MTEIEKRAAKLPTHQRIAYEASIRFGRTPGQALIETLYAYSRIS